MAETPCLFSPLSSFRASFLSPGPIVPRILTCQGFCTWPVFHAFPPTAWPKQRQFILLISSQIPFLREVYSDSWGQINSLMHYPVVFFFFSHNAYHSSLLYRHFRNYLLNICLPTFFPCYWSMSPGLYQLWWPHSRHIAG